MQWLSRARTPLVAVCLVAGLLAGCGGRGSGWWSSEPAPRPSGPVVAVASGGPAVAFVITAAEGAEAVVDDPLIGGQARIVAGRAYHAASGRDCRRFNSEALRGDRTVRSWAACRRSDGAWELVTVGAAEFSNS